MTAAQLDRMREGRQRSLARQRRAARASVLAWHEYVAVEAVAYARMIEARANGDDAAERAAWREIMRNAPPMPRDSAFDLAAAA